MWREHFLWLSANYFAAASVSFCLVLLMYQASLAAAIVVLPLLVVLHLTLRSSYGRLDDASKHLAHLDRLYLSTVETLAMAIDAKDDVTHSHVRRVQAYALGLARALGVTDEPTLKGIEAAALLHDTGKLAVPEHILNKPGKLSEAEFEQMKRHVDVGADILSLVDFPYPVVPIVRCHHENWDGTGYPRGVKGADIPIGARILSVVDCFDALTSDRPYRSALTTEAAFDILRARRGTMYEPLVVDTFIRVHQDLVNQMESFPAHDALRQISRSVASPAPAPVAMVVTPEGVSDDVLAFVSLARLASGDASMADVLSLASGLMRDLAPASTIGWYVMDEATGYLALRHACGPAAGQLNGTALRLGEGVSGWVAANRQVMINSEASLDLGEQAHSGRAAHARAERAAHRARIARRHDHAVCGVSLHREPEPARASHRAASRAGDLGSETTRRGVARTGRAHRHVREIRICASSRRDRHSRSQDLSTPTLPSISPRDIFRPSAVLLRNFQIRSVAFTLLCESSIATATERREGRKSCGSSRGLV